MTSLSLLPIVVVAVGLVIALAQHRQAKAAEAALAAARLIDNELVGVAGTAQTLAAAVAAVPGLTGPGCGEALSRVQRNLPAYSLLAIFDRDQRLACAAPAGLSGADIQLIGQLTGPLPRTADAPAAGKFHIDHFASMRWVAGPFLPVSLSLPAPMAGGLLVLGLDLSWLANRLGEEAVASHQAMKLLVADSQGVVLARWPEPQRWIGARLPPEELDLLGATAPAVISEPGRHGHRRYSGFIPPAASRAGLYVQAELAAPSPALSLTHTLRNTGGLAISAALVSVVAFIFGRRLVLRSVAAQLARSLAAKDAEQRGQVQALEHRLAERTRVLSECNNRLQVEIADRERNEAALRRAQKLQVAGQLTSGVAHDFNNMLATIMGSLELMERLAPQNDDRLQRQIERAIAAVQRGSQLTRRLLAFARRQPPAARPTDINALLNDLIGLAAASVGRRVRIETSLALDLWPAMVDPSGLDAAILNLALNARDAMPEGGVVTFATANATLAEDADPELEAGEYVCITVRDAGVGMTPEVRDRALEPFFSTKQPGGAGLGLTQVEGVVRQAGGAIRIESEPRHGTEVTLLLPRATSIVAETPSPVEPVRTAGAVPVVLLVDDDTAVRNVTTDMLKDLGCNVLQAEGGREALALLDRTTPDVSLAVLDYAMPEMNGVQLAHAIRDRGIAAPIVLATGYAELAEPIDSRASPLSVVLRKPFTINQLQTTLTRLHALA